MSHIVPEPRYTKRGQLELCGKLAAGQKFYQDTNPRLGIFSINFKHHISYLYSRIPVSLHAGRGIP
jgi:hypothetical protein